MSLFWDDLEQDLKDKDFMRAYLQACLELDAYLEDQAIPDAKKPRP